MRPVRRRSHSIVIVASVLNALEQMEENAPSHSEYESAFKSVKYLAIDFGTSNCVASFGADGKSVLVPLQGDSHLLPSVLYVQRRVAKRKELTDSELEKEVTNLRTAERRRLREEEAEIQEALKKFDLQSPVRPAKPKDKEPKRENFLSDKLFVTEMERYWTSRREYEDKRDEFEEKVAEHVRLRRKFEDELREEMRPMPSREEFEAIARRNLGVSKAKQEADTYRSQTFFHAFSGAVECLVGEAAINAYAEDPDGGFFFRSPKTFLGADVAEIYSDDFIRIIETLLGRIKLSAERFAGARFDGLILGRPVQYHGKLGSEGNRQAMSLMQAAAIKIGFQRVHFFLEPVAAAMTLAKSEAQHQESILIVDIGGGTTDCAFLENTGRSEPRYRVLGVSGDRLGGNDADQAIAWRIFMPLLGKGSKLVSGLPMPHGLLYDAISTRDIPAQERFERSGWQLRNYLRNTSSPDKIRRLLRLHANKLQHMLMLSAEKLKIAHSKNDEMRTPLHYLERGLEIATSQSDISDSTERQVTGFASLMQEAISAGGRDPDVVYLTGGMTESKTIIEGLVSCISDRANIRKMESFATVGLGLGQVAIDFQSRRGSELCDSYERQGYAFSIRNNSGA